MAKILLEDGTLLSCKSFGAVGTICGELVFNTGMTGYQEILTDPSYAGQIVTMTYPMIGNYGINQKDMESDVVHVNGLIVKEYCDNPSHWQLSISLDDYLKSNQIIGLYQVDTRMLTKKIRSLGAMKCVISSEDKETDELQQFLNSYEFPNNIVEQISIKEKTVIPTDNDGPSVAVVDLGVKKGIIQQLLKAGCQVTIYPHDVTSQDILNGDFDACLLSNGPGDPKACKEAITLATELKGMITLYGICLGHQILSLSLGADTYKLKFGHRGSNHPVIDLRSGKVYMTSQNHGYAVRDREIPEEMVITHMNVNDDTVEGMKHRELCIESVQFHPEEGPGPTDGHGIIKQWVKQLEEVKTCH